MELKIRLKERRGINVSKGKEGHPKHCTETLSGSGNIQNIQTFLRK